MFRQLVKHLKRGWTALSAAVIVACSAQAGIATTLPCFPASSIPRANWAAADFDGDYALDLAHVDFEQAGDGVTAFEVGLFAFCADSAPLDLGLLSPEDFVLQAEDLDADQDQDLVLRDPFSGVALTVWLNNGKGQFSQTSPAKFPAAQRKHAELRKPAVDWRSDAEHDFLPGLRRTVVERISVTPVYDSE